MICKRCGKTVSLLPRLLYAFYQCTRNLAGKVKSLRDGGLHAMTDVRHMLVGACSALARRLHLSSLYRWARLTSP
jgi:hypothetical protein